MSVGRSVGPSVGPSVMLLSKPMKKDYYGFEMIQTVLDKEKRGTRRKEGRGGRRNEESEKMTKLLKKKKNEKVAKGRIIGLAGLCLYKIRNEHAS